MQVVKIRFTWVGGICWFKRDGECEVRLCLTDFVGRVDRDGCRRLKGDERLLVGFSRFSSHVGRPTG